MITHNSICASISAERDIYTSVLAYLAEHGFRLEETRVRKASNLVSSIATHAARTNNRDLERWAALAGLAIMAADGDVEGSLRAALAKIDEAPLPEPRKAEDVPVGPAYLFKLHAHGDIYYPVLGRGDTEAAAAKDAALRAPKQVLDPLAAGTYVDGAYTYGGLRAEVESAGEARADAGILGGSGGWRVPVATRALSHPSIKGAGEVWMQPGTLVC